MGKTVLNTAKTYSPTVADRLTRSGKSFDVKLSDRMTLTHTPPKTAAMDNELLREMIAANKEVNSRIAMLIDEHESFRADITEENNTLRAEVSKLSERVGVLTGLVQKEESPIRNAVTVNNGPPPVTDDQPPVIALETHQQPRFRELRFMSFAKNDCEGWFAAFERMLHTRRIRDEGEKFDALIAHLSYDVMTKLFGFLQDMPAENQYQALKNKLLSQYALAPEIKLEKVFQDTSLADRRPSEALSDMIRHAGNEIHRDIVMRYWRKRLPYHIRVAIANVGNEQAVEHADNVFDAARDSGDPGNKKFDDGGAKQMSQEMARLRQDIARLTAQVSTRSSSANYAPNPKPSNAKRANDAEGHTRADANSPKTETRYTNAEKPKRKDKKDAPKLIDGQCRAHFDFGGKARYCNPQCSRYQEFTDAQKKGRSGNE